MHKILFSFLGITLVCVICCSTVVSNEHAGDELLSYIQIVFPEAATFVAPDSPHAWLVIYDAGNTHLGFATATNMKSTTNFGYAGATPLLICLTTSSTIKQIIPLPSYETPTSMQQIKKAGLLDAWNNELYSDANTVVVDAVTGATLSSENIIATIQKQLAQMDTPRT